MSPSIPFATSIETPAPLQDALRHALHNVARSDEWAQARAGLMLQDIVPVELESYGVQLQYERDAHASGYAGAQVRRRACVQTAMPRAPLLLDWSAHRGQISNATYVGQPTLKTELRPGRLRKNVLSHLSVRAVVMATG